MNANTTRALLLDAYYQVVDNWIFRLMLLFVLTLVLAAFLVGLRHDRIDVLFGTWTLSYEEVARFLGEGSASKLDVQQAVIQGLQGLLTENLIGQFGMNLCLAATSFFVPRLLEKGAADIVFSKPVSRLSLLLSRYVAGLLFVGILCVILVTGVWLGLVVASGYNDSGFLWSGLTLLYLFAILHAVSIAIGVFTRSSVAAMILAILFFGLTGIVHRIWKGTEYVKDLGVAEQVRRELEAGQGNPESEAPESPTPPILRAFGVALDVAHFVLPKTTDADVIARQLKRATERSDDTLTDELAFITIRGGASGFERIEPGKQVSNHDLNRSPAKWILRDPAGSELASIEVLRRSRMAPPKSGATDARAKPRRLSSIQLGAEIKERVERELLARNVVREDVVLDGSAAQSIRWKDAEREHCIHVMAAGDSAIEIHQQAVTSWSTKEERERSFGSFRSGLQVARQNTLPSPGDWYERRFGISAPFAFNSVFSVASSLAFAVCMMALAFWKLRRIDF